MSIARLECWLCGKKTFQALRMADGHSMTCADCVGGADVFFVARGKPSGPVDEVYKNSEEGRRIAADIAAGKFGNDVRDLLAEGAI